jgi:hypothetical protein
MVRLELAASRPADTSLCLTGGDGAIGYDARFFPDFRKGEWRTISGAERSFGESTTVILDGRCRTTSDDDQRGTGAIQRGDHRH